MVIYTSGENVEVEDSTLTVKKLTDEELGMYGCFDADNNLIKLFDVALAFRLYL